MVSLLLCRLLNSEQAMEFGLKMTKLFLVLALLVNEILSRSVDQSAQIDKQSLSTLVSNLDKGLENLFDMMDERFETDQSSSKY